MSKSKVRSTPPRVLQLIHGLNNGGVERWVVDLCDAGRGAGIAMDIGVLSKAEGLFGAKARERAIPIYFCEGAGNPVRHFAGVRRILREHGPYDAIHCHLHAFSGFTLLAARLEGVPIRIAHAHNVRGNASGSLVRRSYGVLARTLLRMSATVGISPSGPTSADLFGPQWRSDARWKVLPCGLDLTPFRAPIEAKSTRAAIGIPSTALVFGSVGRLVREKNPEFLVDVLAAVRRRRDDAYLVLIGDGPLREGLERKAREEGQEGHLILAGLRSDVPMLLRSIMDVFVFPSPPPPAGDEALPLAVVEAQAAGLPCVVSDGIPPEATLVPELVVQVRADAGAERWAEAVLQQSGRRDPEFARHALELIEQTPHNALISIQTLAALYRNGSIASSPGGTVQ